jgi:hypothetical protein
MELLLNIDELSDITNDGWNDSFKKEEEQQIRNVLQMDDVTKVARVNIGPGSDFMTILTVVNTVVETFLIASKLLEGSEAWKRLIGKIKGFISKNRLVSIDEEGAKILAINYIVEHYSYDSIELVDSHVINIAEVSCKPDASSELAKKPHNYYIQTYRINGEDRLILGVRSDGEVKLIKAFDLSNYGLYEIR